MLHRAADFNTATVGALDEDGRLDFVEAQACVVQLTVKDVEVPVLKRVDDVEHHVCASNHVEDFTTATFAFSSAFDEPGQVENLNFRTAVFHHAGNTGEGRKGIAAGFGVGVGHLGDKGGFSDRGKADQRNGGITGFSNLKPFSPTAGFGVSRCLFLLDLELGNLRLQLPNVGVGGLVLLGLVDLGANHFDLLFDRRHVEPSRIGAWLAVLEGSYATKRCSMLFQDTGDALKRVGPLGLNMGLDMIGLLVHTPTLHHLLSLSWGELKTSMERATLRDRRPVQDPKLTTAFAIDAEANLLDWMDEQTVDEQEGVARALSSHAEGADGLLHLMEWASPGRWEVWEGRAFLYLETATGGEAEDIDDLYTAATWAEAMERLRGVSQDEFVERVVMDWMERRKALGETLDEAMDPKIVPTFEAHSRAAKALVHTVNRAVSEAELELIVGREHLDATKWGHGEWNLSTFLQSQ